MTFKAQAIYSPATGWSVMLYATNLAANDPDYSFPVIQIPAKSGEQASRIADAINDDFAESNRGKFTKKEDKK